MFNAAADLLFVCLAEGIGQLSYVRLLLLLKLPQKFLLEATLDHGKDRFDAIELWTVRSVEDRLDAQGLKNQLEML